MNSSVAFTTSLLEVVLVKLLCLVRGHKRQYWTCVAWLAWDDRVFSNMGFSSIDQEPLSTHLSLSLSPQPTPQFFHLVPNMDGHDFIFLARPYVSKAVPISKQSVSQISCSNSTWNILLKGPGGKERIFLLPEKLLLASTFSGTLSHNMQPLVWP